MKEAYLEAISLIERLHRRFLDVVKSELDRLGVDDINNVQSLILFNIGDEDLTVGELTNRGYYLGTNVTYNLKKLVEYGYVEQERSARDRRSVRIHLSEKGKDLCNKMGEIYQTHAQALTEAKFTPEQLAQINDGLKSLERFWSHVLNYGSAGSGQSNRAA
ncbi:MAG: MarR family transcriptional regulator [Alphaproteobacteria bacterium]|nr:MarR family transcriptional regulator [Alphaproteobacteria bacterium]